jgi:NAD(P)-dependent dehydrogenase (short-subunit alcohol dehydrogenase family)
MPAQLRFDGRAAIVTGAGRGMGREFALLLGQRGAGVVVNDLEGTAPVVDEIRAAGGHAVAAAGDISQSDTAKAAVECAVSAFGRIDIVVSNAALLVLKSFADTTDEDLQRTLEVNVKASWFLAHAAWPHMSAQRYGRILLVSSMNGVVFGTDQHCAYGASKGALAGLARELAFEGRPLGIQVNALLPGAVTTMLNTVSSYTSPDIDLSPALVAPAACWLVHEQCDQTGTLVNASSARVSRVVSGLGEGFQATPASFTLEAVGEHRDQVSDAEALTRIDSLDDYNRFRTARYRDAVT